MKTRLLITALLLAGLIANAQYSQQQLNELLMAARTAYTAATSAPPSGYVYPTNELLRLYQFSTADLGYDSSDAHAQMVWTNDVSIVDGAAYLSTTNAFFDVPLAYYVARSNSTISAWFRPSSTTTFYRAIAYQFTAEPQYDGLNIHCLLDGTTWYVGRGQNAGEVIALPANSIDNDVWQHLVITYSTTGNAFNVWVDATNVLSTTLDIGSGGETNIMTFGALETRAGTISSFDDVAIYSRVWTGEEITNAHQGGRSE